MTTIRTRGGDLLLTHRHGPDAATVLSDPGSVVATAVRISALKDRRRNEEKR